jgi:peptidoglycan/LPS O-acetylase OafA/YrhL
MRIEFADGQKSSPQHYPFLDGIRGLAILWVFLYHSLGAAYGWDHFVWKGLVRSFQEPASLLPLFPFSLGGLGVAIFFAVSGFCIHLSHLRNRNKGWTFFFYRRFFRIYPAYLAALVIFFFLWPWHHYSLSSPTSLQSLFSHLLGVHNLYIHTKFSINPSMWSVGTEFQLYAVYPLLLLIMGKLGWGHGMIAMIVIEFICRTIGSGIAEDKQALQLFALSNSPFSYWFSWAIGAYVAENAINKRREALAWVDFRWLIFFSLMSVLYAPLAYLSFPLIALATAVSIDRLIAHRWQAINFPLARPIWNHLSWLGIISYSFYLLHQPILTQVSHFLAKLGLQQPSAVVIMISCLLLYPLILAMSNAFYRFIEITFIRFGSNFWRTITAPSILQRTRN